MIGKIAHGGEGYNLVGLNPGLISYLKNKDDKKRNEINIIIHV